MEKRLLTILRCPVTNKGLALASSDNLGRVNHAIKTGGIVNRDGRALADPLTEALVTDDAKLMYPIIDGIPVLLEGESINLAELESCPPGS